MHETAQTGSVGVWRENVRGENHSCVYGLMYPTFELKSWCTVTFDNLALNPPDNPESQEWGTRGVSIWLHACYLHTSPSHTKVKVIFIISYAAKQQLKTTNKSILTIKGRFLKETSNILGYKLVYHLPQIQNWWSKWFFISVRLLQRQRSGTA